MPRKNLVQSYEMFTGETQPAGSGLAYKSVSATTTQTSQISNVETSDAATIHVHFSAANSGTLSVEARNIYANPNEPTKGFYPLSFGAPLTITAETEVQILLNTMPFTEIRLIWTPLAGVGTMSAFLNMKTVGA